MATSPQPPRRRRASPSETTQRNAAVDALMRLLADRRLGTIGLPEIAAEAGLTLAELRGLYSGRMAIVADYWRRLDQAVLETGEAEGVSARDRLFDVMMRRFDAMLPHKPALRRLVRTASCDPGLALCLSRQAARSQDWMFAAAGLRPSGLQGAVARRGAAMVFAEAFSTWLDDEEADQAATMAALDRALARGERVMRALDRCGSVVRRACRPGREEDAGRTRAAA